MLRPYGAMAVLKKLSRWRTELRTLLCGDISNKQKEVGSLGEKIARSYLKKKGWRIVASNVKFGKDELDILTVSPNESILAIVEVRSTIRQIGHPESTLTRHKKKAMRRVARQVKPQAMKHNLKLRVDVITVRLSHEIPLVRHFTGVISF